MITVLSEILNHSFPKDISQYDWEHLDQTQDLNLRYLFVVSFDVGYIIDSKEDSSLLHILKKYSDIVRTSEIGCSYITDDYTSIQHATKDICTIFQKRKDSCRFGNIQSLQPLVVPVCLYVDADKYVKTQTQVSDCAITLTSPSYKSARGMLKNCMICTEYLAAIHQCDTMLHSYQFLFDDAKRYEYAYAMVQYQSILTHFSSNVLNKELSKQLQLQQQQRHLLFLLDVLQTTTKRQIQYNEHDTELKISIVGLFISAVTFASFILQACSPWVKATPYITIATILFVGITGIYCFTWYRQVGQHSKILNETKPIQFIQPANKDSITTFHFDILAHNQQQGRIIYHDPTNQRRRLLRTDTAIAEMRPKKSQLQH